MRILSRGRSPTEPLRNETYQTVRLGPGRHRSPSDDVCVMELASMLAGEPFTDYPKSVCPTVSALLRAYNDALGADERQDLLRYASESVGTRADYELQQRRAQFALAWAKSRQYGRGRWRLLRRRTAPARSESTPGDIARYVVNSLGRRHSRSSHAAMLRLLDWVIAMGPPEARRGRRRFSADSPAPMQPLAPSRRSSASPELARR